MRRNFLAHSPRPWWRKLRQAQDFVDKSGKSKKMAALVFFPLAGPGVPP
jgi:hypothetical protein